MRHRYESACYFTLNPKPQTLNPKPCICKQGFKFSLIAGESGVKAGDVLLRVPASMHISPSSVRAEASTSRSRQSVLVPRVMLLHGLNPKPYTL